MLGHLLRHLVISTRFLPSLSIAVVVLSVASLASFGFLSWSDFQQSRVWRKNLKKTGRYKHSNLSDQYDPKYNQADDVVASGPARIKALYIHPIKSCGPIEVDRALLTKTGFEYDRSFAFAVEAKDADTNTRSWRFISQRTKPQMSLTAVELWLPHPESDTHDPLVQSGGCLVVTFPDLAPPTIISRLKAFLASGDFAAPPQIRFAVPLLPTETQIEEIGIKLKDFNIHSRTARGLDLANISSISRALPDLRKFLQIPVSQNLTLLRCTSDTLTRTDRNLAPLKNIGTPSLHGYTDQQPVNINSLSSVHAVSALLPPENQPLNALRFRANIWFTGVPAYAEESWKRCRIVPKKQSHHPQAKIAPKLSVVCRTSRCTMPNVIPESGRFEEEKPTAGKKKGKPQPSTTLIEHRTVESGNPKALGYIGMHCVPEDSDLFEANKTGQDLWIEVGDEIEVMEIGEHLYGSTGQDY